MVTDHAATAQWIRSKREKLFWAPSPASGGSIPNSSPLAEALQRLLSPIHDEYMMAAAAGIFPGTIRKILAGRPVSAVTLAKVARALAQGQLEKNPPISDAGDLASRVQCFVVSKGGTTKAAGLLRVAPLVVAKLIYRRQVNRRFQDAVCRRLDKLQTRSSHPALNVHGEKIGRIREQLMSAG